MRLVQHSEQQIEEVEVRYVDLQTLIRSKNTEREQNKVDVQRLRSLNRLE
jgi:hypothetical protein